MKKQSLTMISMLLIIVLAMGSFTACSSAEKGSTEKGSAENTNGRKFKLDEPAKTDTDKVLTTLINIEPPPAFNGNPFDASGLNWSVWPLMFDYLAYFTPYPTSTFELSMLESYTLENRKLTLTLKDNLKWSDGSSLTADDILTAFYMQAGKLSMWNFFDKIEKINDTVIEIEISTDSPLVLNITFAAPIMTPSSIYGGWAEQYKNVVDNHRNYNTEKEIYQFTEEGQLLLSQINEDLLAFKPEPSKAVCSGQYVISNVTTSECIFTANPHFRQTPAIKTIRGLRPGDAQAFSTAILEEQYTIENGGLSPDMSAQIDKRYEETMRKIYIPELSSIGFSMNVNNYPLNIPEVRKAIATAIDRETLVSLAEPGSFLGDTKDGGLLPSLIDSFTTKEFRETLSDYSYNQLKAEELLTSIGWTKVDGRWQDDKGEMPVISIATIGTWPTFMLTAEAMSAMLTEFGFTIEFMPMEFGVWNDFTLSDEKMISCVFLGGAQTYAHPWESYSNIFSSARAGWPKVEAGQDRIITAPSTGKEYNINQLLRNLFLSNGEDTIKCTEELMELMNDVCAYISLIEKKAPLRIYDTALSVTDAVNLEEQESYIYYGNINTIIAKMLLAGDLYFVE